MKKHHKEHEKKHMKHGGKADGKKGHHKFADGGHVKGAAKMTPTAPMSGAGKMKDRPGLKAASTDNKND